MVPQRRDGFRHHETRIPGPEVTDCQVFGVGRLGTAVGQGRPQDVSAPVPVVLDQHDLVLGAPQVGEPTGDSPFLTQEPGRGLLRQRRAGARCGAGGGVDRGFVGG
jgi:hypothetical protein